MERSPSLASTSEIQNESEYESDYENDYESVYDNSTYIIGYFLDDITEYIECEKACNTYDVKGKKLLIRN